MRDTIHFDDELAVDRDEINDVSFDLMLPSEFPAREPARPQRLP